MTLPKKVTKHIATPVELKKEGDNYVDIVQEMYSSPEVQNYLPLPGDLVGETPSVGDTSGIVVAPAQDPRSVTEQGQEQPLGPDEGVWAGKGVQGLPEAYRGQSEGPPEMVIYVPLTNPGTVSTQGKRMVPVKAPTEDAYEFARFIAGAYRAYIMNGTLRPEDIATLSGLSLERIGFYLRQEQSTHALAIRGVSTEVHLTPEQDYAISILADTSSKLSWNERMRKAGLTQAKLTAWRKNPVFDHALKDMAEQVTRNYDTALIELGRLTGDGNLKAIEKSLEISGRYNPAQQSTVDALAIVNRTIEVLAEHLSDQPELLRKIAKDLSEVQQETRAVESRNNKSIFGL